MKSELCDGFWQDSGSNSKIVFKKTNSTTYYVIDYYENDELRIEGIYVMFMRIKESNTWLLQGNVEKFGSLKFLSPDEMQLTIFNSNPELSPKILHCKRRPLESGICISNEKKISR